MVSPFRTWQSSGWLNPAVLPIRPALTLGSCSPGLATFRLRTVRARIHSRTPTASSNQPSATRLASEHLHTNCNVFRRGVDVEATPAVRTRGLSWVRRVGSELILQSFGCGLSNVIACSSFTCSHCSTKLQRFHFPGRQGLPSLVRKILTWQRRLSPHFALDLLRIADELLRIFHVPPAVRNAVELLPFRLEDFLADQHVLLYAILLKAPTAILTPHQWPYFLKRFRVQSVGRSGHVAAQSRRHTGLHLRFLPPSLPNFLRRAPIL